MAKKERERGKIKEENSQEVGGIRTFTVVELFY
jgi:hypothetical protein